MKLSFKVSKKALLLNWLHVKKNTYTIGKTLLKPACLEIVQLMLGPKEVKKVNKVLLSVNMIKRWIDEMSNDILETLIKK